MRDIVNDTELYGRTYTDPGTNFSDELTMTSRTEVIEGFPEYTERSLLTLVRKILGGTVSVDFEADYETVSASAFYPEDQIEELDAARREALRVERASLGGLYRDGVISEEVYNDLIGEVDEALMQHPGVAEAVTFGISHRTLGEDI